MLLVIKFEEKNQIDYFINFIMCSDGIANSWESDLGSHCLHRPYYRLVLKYLS